jgi:deoxyadenosine/deoxycytidine kinase
MRDGGIKLPNRVVYFCFKVFAAIIRQHFWLFHKYFFILTFGITYRGMPEGKIIAIVGAPRSGKSTLARKLAAHYNAKVFLEGEEGEFPKRIEEGIAQGVRQLERTLWFRTKLVKTYLEARKLKAAGHTVVLDVFWLSPQLYIDTLLEGFERELMWDVAKLDKDWLGYPDLTVFLKISEEGIREFIKLGGRSFDKSEQYLQEVILPVNQVHSQFFESSREVPLLTVERDGLDFHTEKDVAELVRRIDSVLQK